MRSLLTIFAITLIIFFSSCGESYEFVGTQTMHARKDIVSQDTIIYDSINKFYFSRLTKPNTMGIRTDLKLPKENQDQPLWIVFEGNFRTNRPYSFATITLMAGNDEIQTMCWNSGFLRIHITGLNKWCHFKDSLFLPSQLNFHIYNKISAFAFLPPSAGEQFDLDSLTVTIRQKVSNV